MKQNFAEQPNPRPENLPEKEKVGERLRDCLERHIIDFGPRYEGNQSLKKELAGSLAGASRVSIDRCDPPVEIDKLLLESGKALVLFGPNGSGKSTIYDALMERGNAHFNTGHGEGAYRYGKSVHAREKLRIARLDQEEFLADIDQLTAQEVLQTAMEHFKKEFPVDWEDLSEEAYDKNIINNEAQQRIDELMDKIVDLFEIKYFLRRKVKELSGGERTKLTLLMILASEPDILLLDEPTNHLDLESIAKLTGLFELYKRAGLSIISVSHVEWFLEEAGQDGVVDLRVEKGKRKAHFSRSPYARYIKDSARQEKPLFKKPISWDESCGAKFKDKMIISGAKEKTDITDSPLQGIAVPTIRGGDITMFSGKNGTGKTKLMEAIASGKKYIINKEKSVQTAYLPQFWPKEISHGTIRDFFFWIKDGVNPHSDKSASNFLKKLREMGFQYDTKNLMRKKLSSFSGGEQRLLWFAAVSVFEGTDALILDEPTNHMDRATQAIVLEAIRNFPGAVILSTHDLRLMRALSREAGKGRETSGVTNIIFEKENGKTSLKKGEEDPAKYADSIIKKVKASARRVKL